MEVRSEAADGGRGALEENRVPPQQDYDFGPIWFRRKEDLTESKKRAAIAAPLSVPALPVQPSIM